MRLGIPPSPLLLCRRFSKSKPEYLPRPASGTPTQQPCHRWAHKFIRPVSTSNASTQTTPLATAAVLFFHLPSSSLLVPLSDPDRV
ncbi:hypothetical protein G6O67_007758 [Ophiocordyceps sinensis]|uniref:Uncharacterized protein n=1 Tax=Ophiocordyceps sinensis TaxID=72228 RepID=A0A8H4LUH4_9HYPO|nr:hypothetical protein G6O67_007758 [Ophiocordyceps sinensis]